MAFSDIGTFLRRWLEVLTATYFAWREARRAHQSVTVACENGRFVVRKLRQDRGSGARNRRPGAAEETRVMAVLAAGARTPGGGTRAPRRCLGCFGIPRHVAGVPRVRGSASSP